MAVSGNGEPPHVRPAVESAAADWLVRHDRGLTPRQQDEFLQWLAADPAHRESFERHRRMWGDFNALAQWRPEHSAEPNPDLLAQPRRARLLRWVAPAALAAAAAVAVLVWRPAGQSAVRTAETRSIEAAGYRQETLPDGSTAELNRGAHLVLQYSPAERRVVLVQGEAQFTVAKNPARPFVVRAGGVDVRAVGTAFHVKLAGSNLEVLVTEGVVHVAQEKPADDAAPAGSGPRAPVLAELSAGHRTVIPMAPEIAAPAVVAASAQDIDRLLEWRPRLLDFDSTPLADVVAEFNRRNPTRLALGDDDLRTLPIVASIRSDNVEGFVRLLEATMGLRAERRDDGDIVLRRSR